MTPTSKQRQGNAHAPAITTRAVVELFAQAINPPPVRRTVIKWCRLHRVRNFKTSNARRGGTSILWNRGDTEKLVRRITGAK